MFLKISKFNKLTSFIYYIFESLTFCLRQKIFLEFQSLKNKRILEIGCGTGSNSLILAKKGAEVTAIDLSPSQIRLANFRKRNNKNIKLKFSIADAEKL